jgi:hypothetical protein
MGLHPDVRKGAGFHANRDRTGPTRPQTTGWQRSRPHIRTGVRTYAPQCIRSRLHPHVRPSVRPYAHTRRTKPEMRTCTYVRMLLRRKLFGRFLVPRLVPRWIPRLKADGVSPLMSRLPSRWVPHCPRIVCMCVRASLRMWAGRRSARDGLPEHAHVNACSQVRAHVFTSKRPYVRTNVLTSCMRPLGCKSFRDSLALLPWIPPSRVSRPKAPFASPPCCFPPPTRHALTSKMPKHMLVFRKHGGKTS